MSARCSHNVHKTEVHPYQNGGRRQTYSLDEGYNEVFHRWEICDGGLIQRKMDRLHRSKRQHSKPRKKNNKENREAEESN